MMKRSLGEQLIFFVAIILVGVPFAFGLVRASTTGSDYRYWWVAVAAFVAFAVVVAIRRGRIKGGASVLPLAGAATGAGIIAAECVALLQGAAFIPSLAVAFFFSVCFAGGFVFYMRSRPA